MFHFTGQAYLLGFALPNVYFHLTTAYGILRHNRVAIGNKDYLGEVCTRFRARKPASKDLDAAMAWEPE